MQKNGAGAEHDGQEDDGAAQLYRSLIGLVKLQALVSKEHAKSIRLLGGLCPDK